MKWITFKIFSKLRLFLLIWHKHLHKGVFRIFFCYSNPQHLQGFSDQYSKIVSVQIQIYFALVYFVFYHCMLQPKQNIICYYKVNITQYCQFCQNHENFLISIILYEFIQESLFGMNMSRQWFPDKNLFLTKSMFE